MTELDEDLGPIASDLIQEFGKTVLYQSVAQSNYDPTTGKVSLQNVNPITLKAIVEDLTKPITASLVEAGDKKLTLAAYGISKPQDGTKFTFDDKQYSVVEGGVNTIYSGEVACVYEIQVR